MPSKLPKGFDSLKVTPNLSGDSLEKVFDGRAHTAHHRDVGDAITALQRNISLLSHDHSGTSGNPKLAQADTHENADTNSSANALHHSLGTSQFQAAAGNHVHSLSRSGYRTADNLIQGAIPALVNSAVSSSTDPLRYFKTMTSATLAVGSDFSVTPTSGTAILRLNQVNLSPGYYEMCFDGQTNTGTASVTMYASDAQQVATVSLNTSLANTRRVFYVGSPQNNVTPSLRSTSAFRVSNISLRKVPAPQRSVTYTTSSDSMTEGTQYWTSFQYTSPVVVGDPFCNLTRRGNRLISFTERGRYTLQVPSFTFPARISQFPSSRCFIDLNIWRNGAGSTTEIYRKRVGNYEDLGTLSIEDIELNATDDVSLGCYGIKGDGSAYVSYTMPAMKLEILRTGDMFW